MQFVKCLNPRFINNPYTHERMAVPCGKCEACLHDRQGKWVTRLNMEARHWKHVVFFTLTYASEFLPTIDLRSYLLDASDDVLKACEECDAFARFHDYKIPCVSVRDCQLFIKRLRKQLYSHEQEKEKQVLRYHLSSEYGPTSYRPHYHGLLFFSSDWLARNIRECIYKAWSHYSPCTRSFRSIGRSDAQFVSGDAANYVAGYTSFISYLPSLLQCKDFRPFSLHSTQPPIGFADFTDAQTKEIFHHGLAEFSYQSPSTGEIVTLPLWRSFKDRLFPKIKGFSKFNTDERITLYGLATFLPEEVNAYGFYRWLRFQKLWLKSNEWYKPLNKLIKLLEYLYGNLDIDFDFDSFSRLLSISRRVLVNSSIFGCNLNYYVSRIELHYQISDYNSLVTQLKAEQDYCDHVPKFPIEMLPYLIDPLFAQNQRNLRLSVRLKYLNAFGIHGNDLNFEDSQQFQECYQRCHDFYEKSRKTRIKNEYVDSHPQIKTLLYTLNKL